MNGLKCPKCFLIHPENTVQCYCGYKFGGGVSVQNTDLKAGITGEEVRSLKFHGRGYDLFSIFIINVLLIISTLGIYYFWGKVKIKRYLYSQLEFDGDRFTFHGKGKELFFGGIIGLFFLGLTIGAQHFIETSENNYLIAGSVLLFLFLFSLVPVIFVLSRRYYMSRSSWRGIRFSFRGRIGTFYRVIFKGIFLTMATFGLYSPFFRNRI